MASPDRYRLLQQHLDRMPVGFPPTESGVEIRILKRLFTPEEADIALALSALPEPLASIHRRLRTQGSLAALRAALDDMAAKGLIQRSGRNENPHYGKLIFAVGIYEMQLDRLTADFERDVRKYFAEAYATAFHRTKTTQLRTVPVNASIPIERTVATSDDLRGSIQRSPGPFATMGCICRRGKDLLGEPCRQTSLRDNCLTLGKAAEAMVRRGVARYITREEMLRLLEAADAEGLVLEPQNTTDPRYVCCCCGCCCNVLAMAKQRPRPAQVFSTNYRAEVDRELCQGCDACVDRCQMGAIRRDGSTAVVDHWFCIGCGLCVTSCPAGALRLVGTEEPSVPPANQAKLYRQIFRERVGNWGMLLAIGRKLLGLKV